MSFVRRRLLSTMAMNSFQHSVTTPSALPLILIDFDQTITLKDTIAPLGQFGVSWSNSTQPWSYFVDAYLEDYQDHKKQLPAIPEGDFEAFVNQLDSYKPIERASQARVSQHKIFQGLTGQKLADKAISMQSQYLQPGVVDTLQKYRSQTRIVSLNWSKDWILGFLEELQLKRHDVYSNDLEFDEQGVCTGNIIPHILTTGDKQRVIDTFKQNSKVIYIGDSLGDIEALVKANIGIVIGTDKSLLGSLAKFGYSPQEDIESPSSLYRVDTWDQIKHILDRHYPNISSQ